jgi:hypothetical protein
MRPPSRGSCSKTAARALGSCALLCLTRCPHRRAAEQRYELTPLQLTELHPLPLASGAAYRIGEIKSGPRCAAGFRSGFCRLGVICVEGGRGRPCTSATPPKADVNSPPWLPPLCATSRPEQVQQKKASLDNFVGACKERRGCREAERLRSNQIHNEVKLDRLLDRQVCWLRPA